MKKVSALTPALVLSVGSTCQLTGAHAETDLHDDHADGHADFEVEYSYKCGDSSAISRVETMLFEQFPGIEHLRVPFIQGTSQGASHLTPENPSLRF